MCTGQLTTPNCAVGYKNEDKKDGWIADTRTMIVLVEIYNYAFFAHIFCTFLGDRLRERPMGKNSVQSIIRLGSNSVQLFNIHVRRGITV